MNYNEKNVRQNESECANAALDANWLKKTARNLERLG
jgi:hypothetical protein